MIDNIKNIILDLDQTLISSVDIDMYDAEKNMVKASKFRYRFIEGHYVVFERPHLQEFLDFLFKNYNVSIWTAATKNYAAFIVEHFVLCKEGRKLDWIFSEYHNNISHGITGKPKQISILSEHFDIPEYDLTNTIIIDDNTHVCSSQPNNSYRIKPFHFSKDKSEDEFNLKTLIFSLNK